MSLPTEFNEIVNDCERTHKSDIDAAVAEVERRIRANTALFDQVATVLITRAIRDSINDARHKANVRMRRESGYYNRVGRPRAEYGGSEGVLRAHESVYDYRIGGITLGDLTGADLAGIVEAENKRANGHLFNAKLAEWCASQSVPTDRKIRQVISERKLKQNFDRIKREVYGEGPDQQAG